MKLLILQATVLNEVLVNMSKSGWQRIQIYKLEIRSISVIQNSFDYISVRSLTTRSLTKVTNI